MKVLLANPPWLRSGWYGVRAGSRWPHMERSESPYMPFPFLMGYAAAVLEEDGVEVGVIDACAERMDRAAFVERFASQAPAICVLEVSTPSMSEDLQTVSALRSAGYQGQLLLAGLHKPLFGPGFLARHPEIDGTLVGEYEETLRSFVRSGGAPDEAVPGLILRRGDAVLDGGRKKSQQGLDSLPWPARHLFPMDCYHDLPGGIPAPSVQMWASRGCSFTCSFCAWPQILYADNLYRTRRPLAVADEMLAMAEQGYESVYFDDDTFNLGKGRTAAIAKAFSKRGVDLPWAFMGRADTCDPAQLADLRATGLQAVKFGVESADTARLKQIGKNLDVDKVRRSVATAQDLGIKVHLTFMFGLPGETLETMQRTLDLAYELDPDSAQFTVAVPFPGSRLHEELEQDGRLDDIDFSDLDGYRTGVVSTAALDAEQIVSFVHGVHRRWETRERPTTAAPRIPVSEIGGAGLCAALLAPAGSGAWLEEALCRLVAEDGPPREIVVVADASDSELAPSAARACSWATLVDAQPGASFARYANAVPEACTASWIAYFQPGARVQTGWLKASTLAVEQHPQAGALAFPLVASGGPVGSSALSMARWGRVLPGKDAAAAVFGPFGVSLAAGLFRRDLLEEAAGFDPRLPGELAAADLALRGRLLGYGTGLCSGAQVEVDADWPLLAERAPGEGAEAVRAWAEGRVHLLLKSMPREVLEETAHLVPLELAADLYRALRDGRHPTALVQGLLAGARGYRSSLEERQRCLGRRRVGPEMLGAAFRAAEEDMRHCRWQRVLGWLAP